MKDPTPKPTAALLSETACEYPSHPNEFREASTMAAARAFGKLMGRIESGPRYRFSAEDVRRIDSRLRELLDLFVDARIEPAIRIVEQAQRGQGAHDDADQLF